MLADEDETLKVSARDRVTVSNITYKTGFREGAAIGKDSIFQESFDNGFAAGFKAGFQLAKYQGLSMLLENSQIELAEDFKSIIPKSSFISKPSRGCCNICGKDKFEEPITKTIKDQELNICNHLEQLSSLYSLLGNKLDISLGKNITDHIF
ncbi:uncharacterized protein LOC113382622 [Ctenocephalides felis]|uniref:uncharacterized protein LOC113382622 n=1 Tax=Ctenocephalides felis TaxID=7515 RepID=UPI000E6E1077|nr:uncharacterized protein LOC113382622 [Ctenocephalides felis]